MRLGVEKRRLEAKRRGYGKPYCRYSDMRDYLVALATEKGLRPCSNTSRSERRFAPLKEQVPPPKEGELHGADLAAYVEKIIVTRSNVNCVFDMEVNSYMRGYSLRDKKHIRSAMRTISESCSSIRNSKKGATIISRYDVVVARIKQLVADFDLPEAKSSLEIALEYKTAIFSAAYIKDIEQDIEKIKKTQVR